jgi:phage terminase small subunit
MEKKLTLKQQRFVNEYIKTGMGAHSAIKAGYSKKVAKELAYETLTVPHVKAKIEKVMSEEAAKLGINAEYVLSKIKSFAEKKEKKLAPTALKSLELLGRHLKLFHENERNLILEHKSIHAQLEDLE